MNQNNPISESDQKAIRSIRPSRIIIPILFGVGAVVYLMSRRFDPQSFNEIQWTTNVWLLILCAIAMVVLRHIAYAIRLRIMSFKFFNWKKCIELIFVWEFTTYVSPTSIGGSIIALFTLAQEKLSAAKTTTLVIYSIILDGGFFVLCAFVFYLIYGTNYIAPDPSFDGAWNVKHIAYIFYGAHLFIFSYVALFFYGVFVQPSLSSKILQWTTKRGPLKRFHERALNLGQDITTASTVLKDQPFFFHLKNIMLTIVIWSSRFLLVNFLIIAFVDVSDWSQGFIFARLEAMYVTIAVSPTPGGSGVAELALGNYLADIIKDPSRATVIAILWRLISFWSYIIAGIIVIPNWLRKVVNRKRVDS